jgi:hypothetical protein
MLAAFGQVFEDYFVVQIRLAHGSLSSLAARNGKVLVDPHGPKKIEDILGYLDYRQLPSGFLE